MSKKSRKRNKMILAALALAGGAAMLGRGKGVAQGVSGADKAAFTSDAAYKLPSKAVVAADIAEDVVSPGSSFKPRVYPGTVLNERRKIPGYGTANYPGENVYNPYQHIKGRLNTRLKGGGIAKRGTGAAYKSGGRVTGIAKRGFGRALMKGKK
jgi:hypothetical protein